MKFEHIVENYNVNNISTETLMNAVSSLYPALNVVEHDNPKMFWKAMRKFHECIKGKHFNEMYARYQVDEMYHVTKSGTTCKGEMYSAETAKHIYEKRIRNIANSYNCWDVYVAINAQYHDYVELFKEWNPTIIDSELKEKIIASAISFWFKDDDAEDGKVWDYFKHTN